MDCLLTKKIFVLQKFKESLFFSSFDSDNRNIKIFNNGISHYHKMYNYREQNIIADFTPIYYCDPVAITRIKNYNQNAKLIFMIRNPFKRLISHYNMICSNTATRDIWDKVSQYLIDRSLYSKHIKSITNCFSPDQLLVLPFEDLTSKNSSLCINKIEDFLNIDFLDKKIPHDNFAKPYRVFPTLYKLSIYISRIKSNNSIISSILSNKCFSLLHKTFTFIRDYRSNNISEKCIPLISINDTNKIRNDIISLYDMGYIDSKLKSNWFNSAI